MDHKSRLQMAYIVKDVLCPFYSNAFQFAYTWNLKLTHYNIDITVDQ